MKVVRSSASYTGHLYSHLCSWYSFSLGAESTPGPWTVGRNISLKNPVTPPGIDPRTVRLVVQRLNHAIPGSTRFNLHICMFLTRSKGNIFNLITLLNMLESVEKSDYFKGWDGNKSVLQDMMCLSWLHMRPYSCVT